MYVCDAHFLLIWLLSRKNYTTYNILKVVARKWSPDNRRSVDVFLPNPMNPMPHSLIWPNPENEAAQHNKNLFPPKKKVIIKSKHHYQCK